LKESVSSYLFLKDLKIGFVNRIKRTLFLMCEEDKLSKKLIEEMAKVEFTRMRPYNLVYTKVILKVLKLLPKIFLKLKKN